MEQRKFLTKDEVSSMLSVAIKNDRHGVRNHCMIFLAFSHGFRISELLALKTSDININAGQIYIRRIKNGFSTIHPFGSHEKSIIQNWMNTRESYPSAKNSDRMFLSEYGTTLSRKQAWFIIKKCGQLSSINISAHPHMLRHACGYTLANEGADTRLIQDYLGHRNIRHTVHYTAGNAERFTKIISMMDVNDN